MTASMRLKRRQKKEKSRREGKGGVQKLFTHTHRCDGRMGWGEEAGAAICGTARRRFARCVIADAGVGIGMSDFEAR